ncbi:MAG: hypothetical protein DRO15_05790 [Thermoprotei archaeon]|nr:MAG: hypothetical protein DRO15_05790 [Thermoprotei archaeon]
MRRNWSDQVLKWLLEAGFKIEKLEELAQAKARWGYKVTLPPPPAPTTIVVFEPEQFTDRLVLFLGVNIAPEHLKELMKLDEKSRVSFISEILLDVVRVCPLCKASIQPNPTNPRSFAVSLLIFYENLSKARLIEDLITLSNVYTAILANFWARLPITKAREGVFMTM